MAAILHVPFTYFPDPPGGTEIYVSALADALRRHGWDSAVAAPGLREAEYSHNGLRVFRFAVSSCSNLESAYGAPNEAAARGFKRILKECAPRIVHLHAYTSAVSELLVQTAHTENAKVVFTYHTPTVSCARGTMMEYGERACSGLLEQRKCTECVLQSRGLQWPFNKLLARIPMIVGQAVNRGEWSGRLATALRLGSLILGQHQRTRSFLNRVDHVVAVCRWVADVLLLNGLPQEKLTISRQGLSPSQVAHSDTPARVHGAILKLAYFGRLDPTKGVDLLINALRIIPAAPVTLDIYGIRQSGSDPYVSSLFQSAKQDPRISILPAVEPGSVVNVMRGYDMIAIPSRWLETGPLVALEAFAARRPVLGANIGGIPEIVKDGADGILLPPDDQDAWAQKIEQLARNLPKVDWLATNVRRPRTMQDVAADMDTVYDSLLKPRRN